MYPIHAAASQLVPLWERYPWNVDCYLATITSLCTALTLSLEASCWAQPVSPSMLSKSFALIASHVSCHPVRRLLIWSTSSSTAWNAYVHMDLIAVETTCNINGATTVCYAGTSRYMNSIPTAYMPVSVILILFLIPWNLHHILHFLFTRCVFSDFYLPLLASPSLTMHTTHRELFPMSGMKLYLGGCK